MAINATDNGQAGAMDALLVTVDDLRGGMDALRTRVDELHALSSHTAQTAQPLLQALQVLEQRVAGLAPQGQPAAPAPAPAVSPWQRPTTWIAVGTFLVGVLVGGWLWSFPDARAIEATVKATITELYGRQNAKKGK